MPRPKKQPDLPEMNGPGVEKPSIPDIDDAARLYVERRDARIARTDPEVKAKKALLDLMHQHKLDDYEYVDGDQVMIVKIKPAGPDSVVVKVKPAGEEAELEVGEKE